MFQNLQISLHEQIKWNINKPVVLIVFLLCNTIDLSWEGFFWIEISWKAGVMMQPGSWSMNWSSRVPHWSAGDGVLLSFLI